MQNINEKALAVTAEVSKAVLGKPEVVLENHDGDTGRGHVLIEDIPGVGKTTLAQAFARAMDLTQNRVQLPLTFCRPTLWGSRCTKRKPAKFCVPTPAR